MSEKAAEGREKLFFYDVLKKLKSILTNQLSRRGF
jgi:hypothetical protein